MYVFFYLFKYFTVLSRESTTEATMSTHINVGGVVGGCITALAIVVILMIVLIIVLLVLKKRPQWKRRREANERYMYTMYIILCLYNSV